MPYSDDTHRIPIGVYRPIVAKCLKFVLKKIFKDKRVTFIFRGRGSVGGIKRYYGSIPLWDSKRYALYLIVKYKVWYNPA